MKKAFTLIELLIVTSIISIIFIAILNIGGLDRNTNEPLNPLLFPREANAQANQKLAEEIAEQNRLMRELLNKK